MKLISQRTLELQESFFTLTPNFLRISYFPEKSKLKIAPQNHCNFTSVNIFTKIKSVFTKSAMRHELGAGGYNSNPFFGQWLNTLFGMFANTRINYATEAGDLTQSRLIMAAVNFLGRSLPEARLEVVKPKSDGTNKILPEHPLISLFARPNKYYTGDLFWKSFGLSWIIS